MHELAITQSVVSAVAQHAGGRPVARVVLEIGTLSGVMVESVKFCFDIATQGTPLEGAVLDIRTVEARARCRTCNAQFIQQSLITPCACGSYDIKRLSGEELNIKQYQLAAAVEAKVQVAAQ